MKDCRLDLKTPFSLDGSSFVPARSLQNIPPVSPSFFCIFYHENRFFLQHSKSEFYLPEATPEIAKSFYCNHTSLLGTYQNIPCYLFHLAALPVQTKNLLPFSLRELFVSASPIVFSIAGIAQQTIQLISNHKFCSRCGSQTEPHPKEFAMACPACNSLYYPRISPAVIMTVEKDDKILLGRAPYFSKNMYSVLAGFVEIGEPLEDAVRREITEETGLKIKDVGYICSQPWPLSNSLMVGFRSRYAGGEITIDTEELEDARWFSADNLPSIPPGNSIANYLISLFVKEQS